MADPSKWKHFERLVAAIHKLADEGAKVRWNERIAGRQFDVTIRFKKGLYEYLTVIECKNYTKPVPVEKVEAFITKSRDARADRGVMASSSGFQEGAREVAQRHNMTLISVSDSEHVDLSPFHAHWGEPIDSLHIKYVELEYADGTQKRLPEESHLLRYYVANITIVHKQFSETLEQLIARNANSFLGLLDEFCTHTVSLESPTSLVAPDDSEIQIEDVVAIHVHAGMTKAKTVQGPAIFDPYLLVPDIQVQDVTTGEKSSFDARSLLLGIDTIFEIGKFYESPRLAAYYYCNSILDDIAELYMVESFQHGRLIQAKFTLKIEQASHYIEVKDSSTIRRLQRRLDKLKAIDKTT
jgi:hypothetical protein